jgi:hypothetical protein
VNHLALAVVEHGGTERRWDAGCACPSNRLSGSPFLQYDFG